MSETCFISFVRAFLTDLGVDPHIIHGIVGAVEKMIASYEDNKPNENISSIVESGLRCVKEVIDTTTRELSDITFTAIVVLVIVMFVVIVALSYTLTHTSADNSFAVVIVAIVVFVIIVVIVGAVSKSKTRALLDDAESKLLACATSTSTKLAAYEAEQASAINGAFCAYVSAIIP